MQADVEAGMQELRRAAVVAQRAGLHTEAAVVDQYVVQTKTPVFPLAGLLEALHQHGDTEGGWRGH
jgi:hypothetical protein